MQIIPAQPYETNSRAEYRVFDKLKESFVDSNKYIAFHSLNLTKHQYKRFGEADFVIVCEYGLFVFEVKGGGVSSKNGVWHTINRNQEKHRIQNPFTQAETAMHAINKEIKESNKFYHLSVAIGYGVIFPDIRWNEKSSEWDKTTICDSGKFINFETFLSQFFRYWHGKAANKDTLSVENIKAIAQYLRPNFEIMESLYSQLDRVEDSVIRLTEAQYQYLDIVVSNIRVLCSGGAGTGKTFLAIELAKRIAKKDKKVAIICKSIWLKFYLTSKIMNESVTISSIDSAKVDMRRLGLEQYDVLIVDEGQDVFNREDIAILDDIIKNGIKEGEWYIFHDINHQSGLFGEVDNNAFECLKGCATTHIPLFVNCRNTSPIIAKIQSLLSVEMGSKTIDNGPKVVEIIDKEVAGKTLNDTIQSLLNDGIPTSSITLLSPLDYKESSVNFLTKTMQDSIVKLDNFSIQSFPPANISFSEIKNFKGLENEVIIVIDLIYPVDTSANKALYYVAMSRARGLLTVIWHSI
ncbi:MAG: nuclease [Gammaproteobacteria bacterium]|nr:nuclease [Gammaproteobacteria bacterium]